jgi:hypothetical protein
MGIGGRVVGFDNVFGNGARWILRQANSERMTSPVRLISMFASVRNRTCSFAAN